MLTRRPHRRPTSPPDRLALPVLGLLLPNEPAEVAVRPFIAGGGRFRRNRFALIFALVSSTFAATSVRTLS